MPIEVKAYRCSFCGRVYLTKKVMAHEAECFKNPARKSCPTCGWKRQFGEDWAHENDRHDLNGYWCNHPYCPLREHDRILNVFNTGAWEDWKNLDYPVSKMWVVDCSGWKPKEKTDAKSQGR